MKIFFVASQRGKETYDKNYTAIFNTINDLGHKNLDDRMFKSTVKEFYDRMKKEGAKTYQKLFSENIQYIRKADINIFECSWQSFSIGYMVQKSVEMNKPTIVLHDEKTEHPPYFIFGSDDEKLITRSYNFNNVKTVIEEAIKSASVLADKRFNFFINPSLLTYLNQESRRQGITKSTFIRNLILEYRKKNGD